MATQELPLHLRISSTLLSARVATERIMELCDRLEDVERASLGVAVMEWLVNVVKHSYGHSPDALISIQANATPDGMELIIEDTGRGLSAEQFAATPALVNLDPRDPDTLPESGRGLAIIKASMDALSYSTEGGVNRLIALRRWTR